MLWGARLLAMSVADSEGASHSDRKMLRLGHASERGAVNAVRTLFEGHGLVVDEVDGRNDYGRDLSVDITDDGEITGAVIGVQVKGDKRFIRDGAWQLPVTPKDAQYWADSSVPVLGVLWDPSSKHLRWANLTAYARTDPSLSKWPPGPPKTAGETPAVVLFPESQTLSEVSLPEVLDEMREYLRRNSGQALLGLFGQDDDLQVRAVHDCWTLGRSDARAFLLLRHALSSLHANSLQDAIVILSHLTPHPDIYLHEGNWVPTEIENQVRPSFRWSARQVADLVCFVEHWGDEGGYPAWERGGLGQCLYHLLVEDPSLATTLPDAISLALAYDDLDGAFRLLVLHQYLADDSYAAAAETLAKNPALQTHPYAHEFMDQIREFGFVSVY